jgi:hypothetical protein
MILLFLVTCPLVLKNSKNVFLNVKLPILGFIVSKEGKTPNPKKIEALVKMLVPKTPQKIQVFNGMAQLYICFIRNFSYVMAPITRLLRKIEVFKLTTECQIAWENI